MNTSGVSNRTGENICYVGEDMAVGHQPEGCTYSAKEACAGGSVIESEKEIYERTVYCQAWINMVNWLAEDERLHFLGTISAVNKAAAEVLGSQREVITTTSKGATYAVTDSESLDEFLTDIQKHFPCENYLITIANPTQLGYVGLPDYTIKNPVSNSELLDQILFKVVKNPNSHVILRIGELSKKIKGLPFASTQQDLVIKEDIEGLVFIRSLFYLPDYFTCLICSYVGTHAVLNLNNCTKLKTVFIKEMCSLLHLPDSLKELIIKSGDILKSSNAEGIDLSELKELARVELGHVGCPSVKLSVNLEEFTAKSIYCLTSININECRQLRKLEILYLLESITVPGSVTELKIGDLKGVILDITNLSEEVKAAFNPENIDKRRIIRDKARLALLA